ncbi:trypsin-like peptidase domain-containing protein [Streptomyces griseorubiginosus]|uniref:nSTAND1 domain-containing NTPase n=1 Tax=Streptomyces griseorubiginosus TaxID=67304 RepID=UPI0033ADDA0E
MEAAGTAVVRFRTADAGEIVGHGVLVDDEHVVTCAHVVNAALGRDLRSRESAEGQLLRLEFPLLAELAAYVPERRARVDAWAAPGDAFDGLDVAGLTLIGEGRPVGAVPLPLAVRPAVAGDVLMFGPAPGRPGGWVPGRLRPQVTRHRQQVDQAGQGALVAQPRYSGTPVLDPEAGQVLGILVATAVGRDAMDVYAVPVPSITSAWPAVFAPLPPSPYKGLEAFGQEDAHLYFGRAALADRIATVVEERGLVPIVGASGVGKSSFAHAGLLPRLAGGRTRWTFVSVRPRPQMEAALAAGFARTAGAAHQVPLSELEAWQQRLTRDGLAATGELVLTLTGTDRLLLVIDQFEEAVDGSERTARLLADLGGLARRAHSPVVAVLTLREDAFGELFVAQGEFGELLRQTAVALPGMDQGGLREVITAPAALHGITLNDALVRELGAAVGGRPGALPLLEFTLDRMWATLARGQTMLSYDAYQEIGRLDGALAEYADGVLAGLGDAERDTVRHLFLHHLVSLEHTDTRRVARRQDMTPGQWSVAVRLANERLLTVGRSPDGAETVEVVHEALLRAWDTLQAWLAEEEPFRHWRQLVGYARSSGGDDAGGTSARGVLTGPLLADSERWLATRPADVTAEERAFIEASRSRQEQEESRYRTLFQQSLARTLSQAAERAADPVVALLLAVESLERAPDPAVEAQVRAALARLGGDESVLVERAGYEAEFDRMARRVGLLERGPVYFRSRTEPLYAGGGRELWLSDRHELSVRRAAAPAATLRMPMPVAVAAWSADLTAACLATEYGELRFFAIDEGAVTRWRVRLPAAVTCLSLDHEATRIAAACDDGVTRLLDAADEGREAAAFDTPGQVRDIDFGPDGDSLAILHQGSAVIWDLRTSQLMHKARCSRGSLAITGSGTGIVLPSLEGEEITRLIPLEPQRLLELARLAAGRDLTPLEWQEHVGTGPEGDIIGFAVPAANGG